MKRQLLSLLLLVTVCGGAASVQPACAKGPSKKVYTVTDRQVELRNKVAAAAKANELTAKEAEKLNSTLTDIDEDIVRMKAKNGGKLSYKDEGKVEKRLNTVSIDLQKYQLKKRVTAH